MSVIDITLTDVQKRIVSLAAEQCYDILRHEVGDSAPMAVELLRLARDSYRAGLCEANEELRRLRAEMEAIHAVVMSIGDAPMPSESDPYTVREVKRMASLIRSLSDLDPLRSQRKS